MFHSAEPGHVEPRWYADSEGNIGRSYPGSGVKKRRQSTRTPLQSVPLKGTDRERNRRASKSFVHSDQTDSDTPRNNIGAFLDVAKTVHRTVGSHSRASVPRSSSFAEAASYHGSREILRAPRLSLLRGETSRPRVSSPGSKGTPRTNLWNLMQTGEEQTPAVRTVTPDEAGGGSSHTSPLLNSGQRVSISLIHNPGIDRGESRHGHQSFGKAETRKYFNLKEVAKPSSKPNQLIGPSSTYRYSDQRVSVSPINVSENRDLESGDRPFKRPRHMSRRKSFHLNIPQTKDAELREPADWSQRKEDAFEDSASVEDHIYRDADYYGQTPRLTTENTSLVVAGGTEEIQKRASLGPGGFTRELSPMSPVLSSTRLSHVSRHQQSVYEDISLPAIVPSEIDDYGDEGDGMEEQEEIEGVSEQDGSGDEVDVMGDEVERHDRKESVGEHYNDNGVAVDIMDNEGQEERGRVDYQNVDDTDSLGMKNNEMDGQKDGVRLGDGYDVDEDEVDGMAEEIEGQEDEGVPEEDNDEVESAQRQEPHQMEDDHGKEEISSTTLGLRKTSTEAIARKSLFNYPGEEQEGDKPTKDADTVPDLAEADPSSIYDLSGGSSPLRQNEESSPIRQSHGKSSKGRDSSAMKGSISGSGKKSPSKATAVKSTYSIAAGSLTPKSVLGSKRKRILSVSPLQRQDGAGSLPSSSTPVDRTRRFFNTSNNQRTVTDFFQGKRRSGSFVVTPTIKNLFSDISPIHTRGSKSVRDQEQEQRHNSEYMSAGHAKEKTGLENTDAQDQNAEDTDNSSGEDWFSSMATPRIDLRKRIPLSSVHRSAAKLPSVSNLTNKQKASAAANKSNKPMGPPTRKVKKAPISTLPKSSVKYFAELHSKTKLSKEAVEEIERVSEQFWNDTFHALEAYALHAGRKTVQDEDVILLMKTQRLITGTDDLHDKIREWLPMELRRELIPCAYPSKADKI